MTSAAPAETEEGYGSVTSDIEEGDLFLEDTYGASYRLSWTGLEDEAQLTRSIPAGTYRLRTYRIARDQDGERWHVSATAPSIQSVRVEEGANVHISIDPSIHVSQKLGGGRAQMMISGDEGSGLSIYRDGKRIPIEFQVLDGNEEVLASGSMRYG